jgi:hypothetical protein
MNKLRALALTGLLALAAPSAYAIPFGVDILGGSGSWTLSGPTDLSDNWNVLYSQNFDIDPGTYTWNISGSGYVLAVWLLTLDGEVIYANGEVGETWWKKFRIRDDYTFDTNVPEPATLSLLGLALAGLGFSLRRRIRA